MTLMLGYHHPLVDRQALRHIGSRQWRPGHSWCRRRLAERGVRSSRRSVRRPWSPRRRRPAGAAGGLSTNEPSYAGEFYSFDGLTVDPCALQPHMPIWVGGPPNALLRRAVTLADGWCPFWVSDRHRCSNGCKRATGYHRISKLCCRQIKPLDPVGKPRGDSAELCGAMAICRYHARVCAVHPSLAGALSRADPRARGT